MPTFKPKTTKKIKVDLNSNVTLDSKHKELVSKFLKEEKKLPKLLTEKKALKLRLGQNLKIEERIEIEEKLLQLRKQIKDIKSMRKDYYLDNGKYIFDYFENKKDISKGNTTKRALNTFFNIPVSDKEQQAEKSVNNDVMGYDLTDNLFENI